MVAPKLVATDQEPAPPEPRVHVQTLSPLASGASLPVMP